VADPAAIRYRAFLSYSPRDISWGRWLHRELARFRIDRDLVGRVTCPFRKSYPDVMVMQSRQDRDGNNDTGSLN
jgi:hypothetical protein